MNLKDIKPISYIKSHAAEILSQINQTHRPVSLLKTEKQKRFWLMPKVMNKCKNTWNAQAIRQREKI